LEFPSLCFYAPWGSSGRECDELIILTVVQKTIEEENGVLALNEAPLNSMSTKAPKSKKAIDHLLKQKVCVLDTHCLAVEWAPVEHMLLFCSW
jgi:hypothetical protein